jgi:hypothetical protein
VTHLTHGWEPDLPAGDTVLRDFTDAWAGSLAGPVLAGGGTVRREHGLVVIDPGREMGYWTSTVVVEPPPYGEGWEAVVAAAEVAVPAGRGEVHLWSPWPTPDLTGRGWRLSGHPPLLYRPPGGPLPTPAPDLEVTEVRDADDLAAWEQLVVEGYPFPELHPYRPGVLFGPEVLGTAMRLWLGRVAGRPVGAAASYVAGGLHVAAMGVVRPEARRRGYWETLLRVRLEAYPDLASASLFSDMSRPGAQRHGYHPLSRWTLWTRPTG